MELKTVRKAEPRFDVSYLHRYKVKGWGADNLYPQNLAAIVAASSTAVGCIDRYSSFIEGGGFASQDLWDLVLNRRGDTADGLLSQLCGDLAEFGGFAIHVNYNAFCDIAEIQHIPFEACRLEEDDDDGYISHICVHADWRGKRTRNGKRLRVEEGNIHRYDVFNPDRRVVAEQMAAAGGIEFYGGQVLWVSTGGAGVYPVPKCDSVISDMSTEDGLNTIKYRNVRSNFLPAGMLFVKRGSMPPMDDDMADDGRRREDLNRGFADELVKVQKDSNSLKIMIVESSIDEEEPKFIQFPVQNFDKEFTATEGSVVERIYAAFHQEVFYCIRTGKIGFSGTMEREAYEYYNSIVGRERRMVERTFIQLMRHWKDDLLRNVDCSIQPMVYMGGN